MSDSNQYDKKMKYKNEEENRKIKHVRDSKKKKQYIKNTLKDFDIASISEEDNFDDIGGFFWDDD